MSAVGIIKHEQAVRAVSLTGSLWCVYVCTTERVVTSHSLTVVSSDALASKCRYVRFHASASTAPVWLPGSIAFFCTSIDIDIDKDIDSGIDIDIGSDTDSHMIPVIALHGNVSRPTAADNAADGLTCKQ
jgi:hypothetical protein